MSYFLRFDGADDRVDISSGWTPTDKASWSVEIDFVTPSDMSTGNFVIGGPRTGGRSWEMYAFAGTLGVLHESKWTVAGFIQASVSADTRYLVRVEFDGSDIRLYFDDVLVASDSGRTLSAAGTNHLASIGATGAGDRVNKIDLYRVKFWNDPTQTSLAIDLDPSASLGTGSVLTDTAGSVNGTLLNFPTDDSQWVSYTDPSTGVDHSYNVEWRPVGGATTSVTGITDLFYDLTGLTAETDYEFRVQEDDGTNVSGWSDWTGFTTAAAATTFNLSDTAASSDNWSAACASAAFFSSAAIASDNLSSIAAVNASILSAASASDTAGDSPAALASFESAATGSATVDALASAAGALTAGASAGESWSAQAQVLANMLSGAAGSDEIARQTDSAISAAISEGSAAADQFLAAIDSIASLSSGSTAGDAYVAVVAQLAGIASGAIASDTFNIDFGFPGAIQSGALSSDAWLILAALSADLSDTVAASDLMTAKATVSTAIVSGAIASDSFSIVNAGIRYLVMGAITIRSALSQTLTIKPGH